MSAFFASLRRFVQVAWGHHGERILQVLLWSYLAGYVVPFLLAYFVGQPPLALGISLLPLVVLIIFLIGQGHTGFVALFATTEEGRRVFRALLVAVAAQIFTGLAVSLIPIRENRFAAAVAAVAVVIIVLLHFGGDKDGFGRFASKSSKAVAVVAVAVVLLWAFLPRTMGLLDKKVRQEGGVDNPIARVLGDPVPMSGRWVVYVGAYWT